MTAWSYRNTFPVSETGDDSWPIATGSQLVLTPAGIVVAYSPARSRVPYTILHLVHDGQVHVGQLDEHRKPSELASLARRFAREIATALPAGGGGARPVAVARVDRPESPEGWPVLSTLFPWSRPKPVDPVVLELRLLRSSINQLERRMSVSLDNLAREVGETKTVMQSAATLLAGLKTKLDEAIAALPDQQPLDDLAAELDSATNDLAAAVAANTPADPSA